MNISPMIDLSMTMVQLIGNPGPIWFNANIRAPDCPDKNDDIFVIGVTSYDIDQKDILNFLEKFERYVNSFVPKFQFDGLHLDEMESQIICLWT